MAIYYADWRTISRKAGSSAVAHAAYRRGVLMLDERTGQRHDYTNKGGIAHSELTIPPDASSWVQALSARHDRDPIGASAELWNRVERAEKRSDSQLAHEIILALPVELTLTENTALLRAFVRDELAANGMAVDWSVHLGKNDNIHAHVMVTTRPLTEEGFGSKKVVVIDPETGGPKRDGRNKILYRFGNAFWNGSDLPNMRLQWEDYPNTYLARHGHGVRVDCRSHAARGIDVTPTKHIGPHATHMAEQGKAAAKAEEAEAARRQGAREITERPERVLEMITANKAVFTRRDMAREINRYIDDAAAFQALLARLEASPELVELAPAKGRKQARYSTVTMIAEERAMAETADRMNERKTHGVDPYHFNTAIRQFDLWPEQRYAVEHVTGKGQIAAIAGAAGAGKSTALAAARAVWTAEGLRVRGAALAGRAVDGLQKDSGIESNTLHSLEFAWREGRDRLGPRDVLVIDEAGMVGSRQMGRVLAEAERAGAKVVLVGDAEQLQPIEAGAPFRAITDRINVSVIGTIRRQNRRLGTPCQHVLFQGRRSHRPGLL